MHQCTLVHQQLVHQNALVQSGAFSRVASGTENDINQLTAQCTRMHQCILVHLAGSPFGVWCMLVHLAGSLANTPWGLGLKELYTFGNYPTSLHPEVYLF